MKPVGVTIQELRTSDRKSPVVPESYILNPNQDARCKIQDAIDEINCVSPTIIQHFYNFIPLSLLRGRDKQNWGIFGGMLMAVFSILVLTSSEAFASERHFVYTYESGVLNAGDIELEPWTTFRNGRTDFYNRFDNRLEFEVGLTDRLQTAWYLNFTGLGKDVKSKGREFEFEFKGVSSEWKYKLTDPVADAFGTALYLEGSAGPEEAELEAKLIIDKRFGDFLFAFNIVGEHEWEFEEDKTERKIVLEFDTGFGYFLTPKFFAGLELRNINEFPAGEGLEFSALFLGPVLSYAQKNWWATLTFAPQLPALKDHGEDDDSRVLAGLEKINARIIFGFHL